MWNVLNKVAETYEDIKAKLANQTPDGTLADNPERIINVFLYIGGLVAVVMVIVAGIQMTTSAGDPSAVKKAKSTILWSVVGLVVMILAYAVVNFVIFRVVE
ncbi:hypothetical protein IKG31_00205 [Candidatus Saccharibacteria bacterium]|jgi:hypothetical protein|nr:hypothetical protein [Candidatus Saccharibacteria bacterium]